MQTKRHSLPHSPPRAANTRGVILDEAVPLFARHGYAAVSMRDIAGRVGISAAALYHHFPDKQSLYLAAVQHAFADKAEVIREALKADCPARRRLERLVDALVRLIANDPDFRLLLQRELLDGDEERLRLLASEVFAEQFKAVSRLASELAPRCDAHLLVLSLSGLVLHHFEMSPLRRFFPGSRPEHEDPDTIATHVYRLLVHGLKGISRD
jgi:TetR/AcrR family transcriptional regulator